MNYTQAQERTNSFLGTENIGRLLYRMSVPAIIAQLINMLYNIVDRIYIGHIPDEGSLALTGLGICLPLILIITAFASFVSSGGAPRASIAMGSGDYEEAEKILGTCVTFLLIMSALLTAVIEIWCRPMLMAFGGSENIIEYAVSYMRIYAVGTVFVQMTLGLNAFVTAQGFTKTAMSTVIIGAVCNIILDPVFIFVFGMGVEGAAVATIISQAISSIWLVLFMTGKNSELKLKLSKLKWDVRIIGSCIALGIAPFVMQGSESILNVCFNSSLQNYGGDIAVGAMTILSSVMHFALLPINGLAQGAQPITGYNYGAGNGERVKESFSLLLKVSLIYSVAAWIAIMLFPGALASVFTSDAELIRFSAEKMRIYCGAMFMFGIQMPCQMTFISLGNAKCSALAAVIRKFVLLIPLIYIMPSIMEDKITAVYMAEMVSDFIAVGFTAILFHFQFRKALKSMETVEKKEQDRIKSCERPEVQK